MQMQRMDSTPIPHVNVNTTIDTMLKFKTNADVDFDAQGERTFTVKPNGIATHSVLEGIKFVFLTYGMLLPPANEVWGKVIFLHLSVILFTGSRYPPGQVHSQGRYTPWAGTPPW